MLLGYNPQLLSKGRHMLTIDPRSIESVFTFLRENFPYANSTSRKDCLSMVSILWHHEIDRLNRKVGAVLLEEEKRLGLKALVENYSTNTVEKEKQKYLICVQHVIQSMAYYKALIVSCLQSFKKPSGSKEHSLLLSLALMDLFGVDSNQRVEIINIVVPRAHLDFEVLIWGRHPDSPLEDFNSWDDCFIFDSVSNSFGVGLHRNAPYDFESWAKYGDMRITLLHSHDLSFKFLKTYSHDPHHFFYAAELNCRNALIEDMRTFVHSIICQISLPRLEFLPNINDIPASRVLPGINSFFRFSPSIQEQTNNDNRDTDQQTLRFLE
jgi:hypothetical protein